MKKIILVMIMIIASCSSGNKSCNEQQIGTGEFRECMSDCAGSMKNNLQAFDMTEKEINDLNVEKMCVNFCVAFLKRKKAIE